MPPPHAIARVAQDAQHSLHHQKKNLTILHAHFAKVGPAEFYAQLEDQLLLHVLDAKKGAVQVDRCFKLITAFVRTLIAKTSGHEQDEEDMQTAHFTSQLAHFLLQGFRSKHKNVRYRCVQLLCMLLQELTELDADLFSALLDGFSIAVRDKEAGCRVLAVLALVKLQSDEDPGNGVESATDLILNALEFDPSADVRKTALAALSPAQNPHILGILIARTRDVDPHIRKAFYAAALPESILHLNNDQRTLVLLNGLKDRDANVKKAAQARVVAWFAKSLEKQEGEEKNVLAALLEFVELLDTTPISKDSPSIAEEALRAIFAHQIALDITIPDEFWVVDLTPLSSFVIRCYVVYLKAENEQERLDEIMPEIMKLSFAIEATFGNMQREFAENDDPDKSQLLVEDSQILIELLKVADEADFADELGRRKLFGTLRDLISYSQLPIDVLPHALNVLRKIADSAQDFMRVIVEIVQNIREDANVLQPMSQLALDSDREDDEEEDENDIEEIEQEEDVRDLEGEARAKKILEKLKLRREAKIRKTAEASQPMLESDKTLIHLRCLEIVKALLACVSGNLQDNATLIGLVHELIVPSVRSKDPDVREQGLICLGLCSLLDKNMALDSFGLFVHQSQSTEGDLQLQIYRIIFDILMLYSVTFLEERGHSSERVVEFLLHALNQDSYEIQSVATIGIAKLMLSGILDDEEVLKRLVLVYFAPETADNQELRQCLSYFFPVYSYSSPLHQKRMQQIFISVLEILSSVYDELEDQSIMVAPSQIALQMVDWTDPLKAVEIPGQKIDTQIHVNLAQSVLEEIYREQDKDKRKALCQLLNKLHIPETAPLEKLHSLNSLIDALPERRPLADAVSKNALTKFNNSVKAKAKAMAPKRSESPAGSEDGEAPEEDEESAIPEDVQAFLAQIDAENDENDGRFKTPAAGKRAKASSRSKATAASTRGKKKAPARTRTATPSSDEDSESDDVEPAPAPVRKSTRTPRAAASKIRKAATEEDLASVIGSDSDEEAPGPPDESEESEEESE